MITTKLEEIKFYLSVNGNPIDDRVFEEYHEAEYALNELQLLNESYADVNISSYKVLERKLLNG